MTENVHDISPPTGPMSTPPPDPYTQQAMAEEQRLLDEAVQKAQLQHLLDRCMELSVEVTRLRAEKKGGDDHPIFG